jgi:hypothetical protein
MGFGVNTSPWLMTDTDGQGNVWISLTVPYADDAHGGPPHTINQPATIFRAANSPRTKAVIGNPLAPDKTINIPAGTHTVSVAAMNGQGLFVVEDLTSTQITFI